ncbi:hypothetical protein TNCV_2488221 [Trichonephila clavipes]|nr:hypothetical protein TNCV_2488221 [Trichonephila clavipes]
MQIYHQKSNPFNIELSSNIHRANLRKPLHLQKHPSTIVSVQKYTYVNDYSPAHPILLLVETILTIRWLKSDSLTAAVTVSIGAAQTFRNITSRVIDRDFSGPLHKFLEVSRGFLNRQYGRQGCQNDHQSHQIGH